MNQNESQNSRDVSCLVAAVRLAERERATKRFSTGNQNRRPEDATTESTLDGGRETH